LLKAKLVHVLEGHPRGSK